MEPTISAHLGCFFVNSQKEGTDQNMVGSLVEVKAPEEKVNAETRIWKELREKLDRQRAEDV